MAPRRRRGREGGGRVWVVTHTRTHRCIVSDKMSRFVFYSLY